MVESKSSTLMAGQLIDHVTAAGTVSPMIEGRITRENWLFYSDLFGPWADLCGPRQPARRPFEQPARFELHVGLVLSFLADRAPRKPPLDTFASLGAHLAPPMHLLPVTKW